MNAARALRRLALAAALTLATGLVAEARDVVDSAGRRVTVPDTITRVFAAGPPAAIAVYVVAPKTLIGWPRALRDEDKPFIRPEARDLPETGRLTGRGDTVNTERLMAERPDVIVDFGSTDPTYRSIADRIQAQTGIPYLLIDGRFAATAASLRLLGTILGAADRGEMLAAEAERILADVDRVLAEVPPAERPKLYLARGNDGFETGSRGSINTEILKRVGGINVAVGLREAGGLVHVSPEQVLVWAPDTIVTIDPPVRDAVLTRPEWQAVPAVARRRVFLAPSRPFGSVDFPPSVNRLVGLPILTHVLYPGRPATPLRAEVARFHRLFYGVEPDAAMLDGLLAGLEK